MNSVINQIASRARETRELTSESRARVSTFNSITFPQFSMERSERDLHTQHSNIRTTTIQHCCHLARARTVCAIQFQPFELHLKPPQLFLHFDTSSSSSSCCCCCFIFKFKLPAYLSLRALTLVCMVHFIHFLQAM